MKKKREKRKEIEKFLILTTLLILYLEMSIRVDIIGTLRYDHDC